MGGPLDGSPGQPGAEPGPGAPGSVGTDTGPMGTLPNDPSEPVPDGSSSPAVAPPAPGPRLARLTHFQWQNAVQDLLRLPSPPQQVDSFTPDAIVGFDTNATQLRMSSTLREDYELAAEELAMQVVSDPSALARLLPDDAPADSTERARAFIEGFGLRAYRRPLTTEEVDEYLQLFERGPELAPDMDPFEAGVMLCIRLFLQSPHFLYRTELGQETVGDGLIGLNDYEVAAKLALALTGSTPDDELLDAAAAGTLDPLNNKSVIDAQARRLLDTPRGKAAALHLHTQALALSRYDLIRRDPNDYPEYQEQTPTSMRRSAELFLETAYDEGWGLRSLLASSEAFVDSTLAPIYGIEAVNGTEFARVDLTDQPRRGFLTQPGFLALFAGENHPDPIHRGVFINQQILCIDLPPPAPDVPPLPEPQPNQTNRERIDLLTGPGTCGEGCHTTWINPLGYAFEHYDPLGRYRTTDAGVPVDASDSYMLDGGTLSFDNAIELVELLSNSDTAHRCYAEHWLAYLYGRPTATGDSPTLDALAARSNSEDLSVKDVVLSLALDDAFLTRPDVEQP